MKSIKQNGKADISTRRFRHIVVCCLAILPLAITLIAVSFEAFCIVLLAAVMLAIIAYVRGFHEYMKAVDDAIREDREDV